VLLVTAGTALAEPPAWTNPNVVECELVECGEFTGTVAIVAPESEGGCGNIVVFSEGQEGILISLVPAGLPCLAKRRESRGVTARMLLVRSRHEVRHGDGYCSGRRTKRRVVLVARSRPQGARVGPAFELGARRR
jgi:hypothetical protein